MKLTAVLILLLAGTATAAAKSPAEDAWYAYRAGEAKDYNAVPRLIEMIRIVPENKDIDRRLVVRAAFDALIRLEAPVKGEILKPYLGGRFRSQALILLAPHAADNHELLLGTFDRQTGKTMNAFGIAVGNLLTRAQAPGLAPRLLRRVEMNLTLVVTDEDMGTRIGAGGISVAFGDGRLDVPKGFPPTVLYELSIRKQIGGRLLADGPHPVRYFRQELSGRRLGVGSSGWNKNTPDLVREWLAALIGKKPKSLNLPANRCVTIVFENATQFLGEASKVRNRYLANHVKLVNALVEKKLLSEAEAMKIKPKLEIVVDDQRRKQESKLPKLPAPAKPRK